MYNLVYTKRQKDKYGDRKHETTEVDQIGRSFYNIDGHIQVNGTGIGDQTKILLIFFEINHSKSVSNKLPLIR